jgi:hypothetical protein
MRTATLIVPWQCPNPQQASLHSKNTSRAHRPVCLAQGGPARPGTPAPARYPARPGLAPTRIRPACGFARPKPLGPGPDTTALSPVFLTRALASCAFSVNLESTVRALDPVGQRSRHPPGPLPRTRMLTRTSPSARATPAVTGAGHRLVSSSLHPGPHRARPYLLQSYSSTRIMISTARPLNLVRRSPRHPPGPLPRTRMTHPLSSGHSG